jgi:hypothetical protein
LVGEQDDRHLDVLAWRQGPDPGDERAGLPAAVLRVDDDLDRAGVTRGGGDPVGVVADDHHHRIGAGLQGGGDGVRHEGALVHRGELLRAP